MLPNGIVTEFGYDLASHLTGLTYKLAGNVIGTYDYDAAQCDIISRQLMGGKTRLRA